MKQSFVIHNEYDLMRAHKVINSAFAEEGVKHELQVKPFVKDRKAAQNRLQHHWFNEIHRQRNSIEEMPATTIKGIRSYSKLHYGVPIMEEDEDFAESWRLTTGHLNEEYKLKAVYYLPVTRLMKVEQFTRYLNDIRFFWESLGAKLTTSQDFYFEAMGLKR